MLDPTSLYELDDDLPVLDRPVLIQALSGFVDAGNACRIARDHLMSFGEIRRIATFDLDQLFDYRARRPVMVFNQDHWDHYEEPQLVLSVIRDRDGAAFLLLSGPEPDLRWEGFVEAVFGLVERFDVRLTIGLSAIPMAVPHTRPVGITAYATRKNLTSGYEVWPQRIQVPGSVGTLMEYRWGQRGREAMGFAVHVPHYLAQAEYPAAAERIINAVVASGGLHLPTDDLQRAAEIMHAEIDRQVVQSEEASSLVSALEQQYDAQSSQRVVFDPDAVSSTGPLPTADELAAELERFLADQSKPGE